MLRKASSPKGAPLSYAGNFIATTKSRPLGEGGCERSEQTEGVRQLRKFSPTQRAAARFVQQPFVYAFVRGQSAAQISFFRVSPMM